MVNVPVRTDTNRVGICARTTKRTDDMHTDFDDMHTDFEDWEQTAPSRHELRNGIWPRSFAIWVVAFWMVLLTIRPWEKLFPELAALRVELCYALFAIIAVSLSGRVRMDRSRQTTGLLVWAAALTISAIFAIDTSAAWNPLYVYYTIFVFYFVMVSVVRTHNELVFLVICFVVATTIFLAKSQWEYFVYEGYYFSMGVSRLQGMNDTYGHPNAVASMAVMTLPLLAFLWDSRPTITASWPQGWRRLFPWGIACSLLLVLSSVVLTNSRSGMLGVCLAVSLWTLSCANFQKILSRLLIALLLLTVIWVRMPEDSKGRLQNLWDAASGPEAESAHSSAEGRIEGLKAGLEMYRRFPLTGVGLGNFMAYRVTQLDGVNLVAHNIIGGVLGETGTIGGVAFLVFISGIFVNYSKTKKLAADCKSVVAVQSKQLAVSCRNSMILILFLGMFHNLESIAQVYWIAAFCALGCALCSSQR